MSRRRLKIPYVCSARVLIRQKPPNCAFSRLPTLSQSISGAERLRAVAATLHRASVCDISPSSFRPGVRRDFSASFLVCCLSSSFFDFRGRIVRSKKPAAWNEKKSSHTSPVCTSVRRSSCTFVSSPARGVIDQNLLYNSSHTW